MWIEDNWKGIICRRWRCDVIVASLRQPRDVIVASLRQPQKSRVIVHFAMRHPNTP